MSAVQTWWGVNFLLAETARGEKIGMEGLTLHPPHAVQSIIRPDLEKQDRLFADHGRYLGLVEVIDDRMTEPKNHSV